MDSCIAVIPICIHLLMCYWNYKPLIISKQRALPQSTKYCLNHMNKTKQYLAQKSTSTSPWWTGGNGLNVWLTEEFFLSLKWVVALMSGFLSLAFLSCQFAHMSFCDLKHWSSIMIIFFKSWHFSVTNCMSWVISARNYPFLYC